MMKHTEMFSTRDYTTKNNFHLTKTRTTRKIQLTLNKPQKSCLKHKVFQNFGKQKRALQVRSCLTNEETLDSIRHK